MNSRFTFAIVLLLSSVPYATFAQCSSSDRECKSDLAQMMCDCRETNGKLVVNTTDAQVFLSYLVGKELLTQLPSCHFNAEGRLRKFTTKYVLNRIFFNDSVNVTLDLPSAGEVTVLNTDQLLEVLLVVIHDLIAKKSVSQTFVDGALTLTREEIVAALVWILCETNVESLLPNDIEDNRVYQETRNEVARYYVDKAIAHIR